MRLEMQSFGWLLAKPLIGKCQLVVSNCQQQANANLVVCILSFDCFVHTLAISHQIDVNAGAIGKA